MKLIQWLAALPALGMLAGPFFLNRVEPLVLGMPLLLAWLVGCTVATSATLGVAGSPSDRRMRERIRRITGLATGTA